MPTRRRNNGNNSNDGRYLPLNIDEAQKLQRQSSSNLSLNGSDQSLEYGALLLQLVLYTIQGIPMGLSSSIPLVLVSNDVPIRSLAKFSMVSLPFSLKILWAPIVDCLTIRRFGRRKCWLMPTQILCGLLMVMMGLPSWWDFDDDARPIIDQWLEPVTGDPNLNCLFWLFIGFYALMATQDIVVDGWAVSMLAPANRGLASSMNTIGQSLGIVLGNSLLLTLRDPESMMSFFGTTQTVSLGTFTGWCGAVMIVVSLLLPLKSEANDDEVDDYGIFGTSAMSKIMNAYICVFRLASLPTIIRLGLVLLCTKLPFAAVDRLTTLELVRAGLTKERMAMLSPITMTLSIIVPLLISGATHSYSTNDKLILWGKAYAIRLVTIPLSLLLVVYVKWYYNGFTTSSHTLMNDTSFGKVQASHWGPLVFYLVHHIVTELIVSYMFLIQMAIFNEVADPKIGGIYMTFLNTIANMGSLGTGVIVFRLHDMMPFPNLIDPYVSLTCASFAFGLAGGRFVQHAMLGLSRFSLKEWRIAIGITSPSGQQRTTELPKTPPPATRPPRQGRGLSPKELDAQKSPTARGSEGLEVSSPIRRTETC